MTQEGKNVSSVVVFTKQFEALAGWRRASMNEGINALFSTCQRRIPHCGFAYLPTAGDDEFSR
jgi:hypothetical protein